MTNVAESLPLEGNPKAPQSWDVFFLVLSRRSSTLTRTHKTTAGAVLELKANKSK